MASQYAVMPPPPSTFAEWLTPKKLIGFGALILTTLVGTGWFLLPAKERDLRDLGATVQRVDERVGLLDDRVGRLDARIEQAGDRLEALSDKMELAFERMGDKLDKLKEGQTANREELIRLGVAAMIKEDSQTVDLEMPSAVPVKEKRSSEAIPPKPPRKPKTKAKAKPVVQAQQPTPTWLQKILQ